MKSVLYKIVLFLKKHLCLPLSQRFEKTFDHENKLKHLSEYICRQLKYHQHRIRSETGMSLEMILDVFKWPIVSLVPLKNFYFGNSTTFFYFSWHPLWIYYSSTCVHFTAPERWGTDLLEGTDVHVTRSAIHSSKRFKPLFAIILLCQGYCWIGKKQGIQLCCRAYDQAK